jgi:hypothetical protein
MHGSIGMPASSLVGAFSHCMRHRDRGEAVLPCGDIRCTSPVVLAVYDSGRQGTTEFSSCRHGSYDNDDKAELRLMDRCLRCYHRRGGGRQPSFRNRSNSRVPKKWIAPSLGPDLLLQVDLTMRDDLRRAGLFCAVSLDSIRVVPHSCNTSGTQFISGYWECKTLNVFVKTALPDEKAEAQ